jgi:hypothetical protein
MTLPAPPVRPNAAPSPAPELAWAKQGDILLGFSTTGMWLSRLIRWATGSKYSHAWIRHGSEVWGGDWITQADLPVVRTWPERTASQTWTVKRLYRPRFNLRPALARVRADFDEPYDVWGLFGMAVVTAARKWLKRKIKNPWASPKKVYCSEFVVSILLHVRLPDGSPLPGLEGWDPETSSPQELESYCASQPAYFEPVRVRPSKRQRLRGLRRVRRRRKAQRAAAGG